MSQQELPIEVRLAQTYLDSFHGDPLYYLKDIKQYGSPNFVGKDGRFYLCRCFVCPDAGDHGTDNYHPNRALGMCTWCGWKHNTEVVAYIYAKMVVAGKVDMNELKELKIDYHPFRRPYTMKMPVKTPDCGITIEEIKERYPEQYEEALSQYTPENQEDDGEID